MILSLLLIVLSCTSLSLSAMDPLKLWRAAQETNQPWHRICASVSSASALRELKEGQTLPSLPNSSSGTKGDHDNK